MAARALDLDRDDLALGQLAVALTAADVLHGVSLFSGFRLTGLVSGLGEADWVVEHLVGHFLLRYSLHLVRKNPQVLRCHPRHRIGAHQRFFSQPKADKNQAGHWMASSCAVASGAARSTAWMASSSAWRWPMICPLATA